MMKNVEKKAMEFGNDVEKVNKKIRSLQSAKSRLVKNKFQADYDEKMEEILKEIQILSEVRNLLTVKPKTVPEYEQEDVDRLDYDETIKALKTIQSKKYHTRWLTEVEGVNDEFRRACKIEEMLNEHKAQIRPVDDRYVRKSDLMSVIETIENSGNLSQDRILGMLRDLVD